MVGLDFPVGLDHVAVGLDFLAGLAFAVELEFGTWPRCGVIFYKPF